MSKVVLPIKEEALFLSMYESSVYFSVIQAQAERMGRDITPWLVGLMANYYHCPNFLWEFDTIKRTDWYVKQELFHKKHYQYDDRMPGWDCEEIQNLLICSLKRGRYIHTKMDTFYLPDDASYQAYHRTVECLLYGFDSDRKELYFIRFFPSQPITLCVASFNAVVNAICKKENHYILLDILEFNMDFPFRLDEEALHNDLYDFLHSTRQSPRMTPGYKIVYGLKSLDSFRTYLCEVGVYYEYIDQKNITSFYDFQTITHIRYRYLKDNGYLLTDIYDSNDSQLLVLSKQFLSDCIAFNQIQSKTILKQILEAYDKIVDIDIVLSQIMFDSLKKHMRLKS